MCQTCCQEKLTIANRCRTMISTEAVDPPPVSSQATRRGRPVTVSAQALTTRYLMANIRRSLALKQDVTAGVALKRAQRTYRPDNPDLLTRAEAALVIGVSVSSMNQWSMAGRGPRFVRLGKSTYYKRSDLAAWISTQSRAGREA